MSSREEELRKYKANSAIYAAQVAQAKAYTKIIGNIQATTKAVMDAKKEKQ